MNKMNMTSWSRWDFESSDSLIRNYKKYFDTCDTLLEVGSLHGRNANQITTDLNVKNTYIIEANVYSYDLIKKRYPNYNIYNYAFGDKNKEIQFNSVITDNPGTSSVLNRPDGYYDGKTELTNVQMYRGDTFIKNENINNIDILKIDVEWFTYEVLKGFGESLKNIKFIEAECENKVIWQEQKTFKYINEYILSKGFICLEPNYKKTQFNAHWIKK